MDQLFLDSLSPEERIRLRMEHAHRERVRAIVAGETPFPLRDGTKLIVQLIPEVSAGTPARFPASELKAHGEVIVPLGKDSGSYRFNVDGFAGCDEESRAQAYTQLYRDGRLEAVMANAAYEKQGEKLLHDDFCERAIISLVRQYLFFAEKIGISSPFWLFAAMTGCQGVKINTWHRFACKAIDRDTIFLSDSRIEQHDIDPNTYLRPVFDCLANAVGLERSLNYDEQGNRRDRNDS